jgi:hypothetical protein
MLTKLLNRGKRVLKQELLLRRALSESGVNHESVTIEIDHLNGVSWVNGIPVGVVYPRLFFETAAKLIPRTKELDFYFNGNMNEAGARREMLSPFASLPRTRLVNSNAGRLNFLKARFNRRYFRALAGAKFGLCPHQRDWPGDEQTRWTYRFIECCMVNTLPVVFDEAPLGEKFVAGFHFHMSQAALAGRVEYSDAAARANAALAGRVFTLSDDVIGALKAEEGRGGEA